MRVPRDRIDRPPVLSTPIAVDQVAVTNYNWTAQHPRFVADLNGDGMGDIVGIGPDCVWTAVNQGGSSFAMPKFAVAAFDANSGWRVADHPRFVTDLTGDGRADIIGFGDDWVWVCLGNGDGTFQPMQPVLNNLGFNQGWRVGEHPRFVADLTGDGRADIIGFGDAGIWTALGNGDGTFRAERMVSGDLARNTGWRTDTPRFVADLTGDGRADIVGFGDDGVWVCLGNGDGTFKPAGFMLQNLGFNQGWRVGDHPRFVTDLTGDGRADLIGFGDAGIWTALGNGDGTFRAERMVSGDLARNTGWRADTPRFVADLTGDGRADIVGFGDDGVWVCLGNGDGTFKPAGFMLQNLGFNQGWRVGDHPRFVADLTGDGKGDIIGFGDDGIWTALGNGDGTFRQACFVLADFGRGSNRDRVVRREIVRDHRAKDRIKHVFVLMLENRSYDHMLGYADLRGPDAATGQSTTADGVIGKDYFNCFSGHRYPVKKGSPDITVAPGHGFLEVLEQLCGQHAIFTPGQPYPEINNTGYVSQLAKADHTAAGPEIMQCFDSEHLTALTALAEQFAVCDRWFSSMPGPTEPNRMFLSAATSGRHDDSPTTDSWPFEVPRSSLDPLGGFEFDGGNIFEAMDEHDIKSRVYAGDSFPFVGELKGVHNFSGRVGIGIGPPIRPFGLLEQDLQDPGFDASYIHIEPNYFGNIWNLGDFGKGNSQHPTGGVAAGEQLIKATYEAIRNSPHWMNSLLIITYDEHGGFYDHVAPGPAQPTGSTGSKHHFKFDQLGPRVPAVVVSPWIQKGTIEHRLLEHTSVIATLCDLFDIPPLAHSRTQSCGVAHLANLSQPRTDTPTSIDVAERDTQSSQARRVTPEEQLDGDHSLLDGAVRVAAIQRLRIEPLKRDEILAQLANLRTGADKLAFLREADTKIRAARTS